MPRRVEGVVKHVHFPVFIYVLRSFFQHDHPNSQDMFFSNTDECICVSHNRSQSGKGVIYQVTI